jgi:hypothetical protein
MSLYTRSTPLIVQATLLGAVAALLTYGCGSSATTSSATKTAASGASVPHVPARDRFTGTLHASTGALAGAGDVLEARLQAPGITGRRRLTVWILSTRCRSGAPCVHLNGSLRGQLTQLKALPDVGRRYAIAATGSLHGLGAATASGTAAGTGNINSGVESLLLTLRGKLGSGRLIARSSRVSSFTSP